MERMFELLKQDHKRVSSLIGQISRTSGSEREDLFDELTDELEEHMDIEERLLYPKLHVIEETKDIIKDALEEHKMIKKQLDQLSQMDVDDDEFDTTLESMRQSIENHVQQEETSMFPLASKVLSRQDLQSTNKQIVEEKEAA